MANIICPRHGDYSTALAECPDCAREAALRARSAPRPGGEGEREIELAILRAWTAANTFDTTDERARDLRNDAAAVAANHLATRSAPRAGEADHDFRPGPFNAAMCEWCANSADDPRHRARAGAGASEPSDEALAEEVLRVAATMPPHYAYGDNEAACWMADALQRLAVLASRRGERGDGGEP